MLGKVHKFFPDPFLSFKLRQYWLQATIQINQAFVPALFFHRWFIHSIWPDLPTFSDSAHPMDYYVQFLHLHLTETRPDLFHSLGRDDFFSLLKTRSEAAAAAFEQARLAGHDVNVAQEEAMRVLTEGLEHEANPDE